MKGKLHADTGPLSISEWFVRMMRHLVLMLEPFRPEFLGVLSPSAYIRMILNESLRLWPTAPAFSLYPKEDTVIGGKFPITTKDRISVLIPQLHRDRDAS